MRYYIFYESRSCMFVVLILLPDSLQLLWCAAPQPISFSVFLFWFSVFVFWWGVEGLLVFLTGYCVIIIITIIIIIIIQSRGCSKRNSSLTQRLPICVRTTLAHGSLLTFERTGSICATATVLVLCEHWWHRQRSKFHPSSLFQVFSQY